MFISSPKGTDGKTMAFIKWFKCILQQPICHIILFPLLPCMSILRGKRLSKRCPWGTTSKMVPFFQRGTLFILIIMSLGHRNSTPKDTDSQIVLLGVLFRYPFFWVCCMILFPLLLQAMTTRLQIMVHGDSHYLGTWQVDNLENVSAVWQFLFLDSLAFLCSCYML